VTASRGTEAHARGVRMKAQATGLHPFVPAGADFALALAFFAELGFETAWTHDGLAGLRYGAAFFFLQQIEVPEWQQNQMLTLEVDDLDGYWSEIEARTSGPGFPACGCGRRRSSHGAARSTSPIPPACAGTYAKRRSADKKLD
jgi:hypothetical protein